MSQRALLALLLVSAVLAEDARPSPREETLRAWREGGKKRLDAAQAALAKRREEAAARREAEGRRVREATAKAPVDIDLATGKKLRGCAVLDVKGDAVRVRCADPASESMRVAFSSMTPRSLFALRRQMTDPEDVEGRFALGRLAARIGLYDEAQKEFDQVVAKDPSYQDRLPDLRQLRTRNAVFHGRVTAQGGDRYQVVYDFSREEQALDFTVDGGEADVKDGAIALSGRDDVTALLREVALVEELSVTADGPLPPDGVDAYWGATFSCAQGKTFGVAVARDAKGGRIVTQDSSEADWEEAKQFDVPEGAAVRLRLAHGTQLSVVAGSREVWSQAIPRAQTAQVFLQGEAEKEFTVSFRRLELSGRFPREWMRKVREDVEAAALRTLEDDLAAPEAKKALAPLSAEAVAEEPPSEKARTELQRLRGIFQRPEVDDAEFGRAVQALLKETALHPKRAAAWYALSEAREFEGREDQQFAALTRAIEAEPAFPEALARRAWLHVDGHRYDEAEDDVDRALAIAPDSEAAIRARGYLAIGRRRYADAAEDFELALALDPSDAEAQSYLRAARRLLAGPWPEGSARKECRAETEHYVVRTDISERKAEQYAQRLEKARAIYEKGIPPAARPTGKAEVLVFDSEEEYHTYAELTENDRQESTLGHYSPFYGQLFLFEGATDLTGLETLHVLYHEAFHQYLAPILPSPPTWVDEGLADYYAGKVMEAELGGKRDPDLQEMVAEVQSGLASGWKTDFARLLRMSQQDFYGEGSYTRYAQGWSMCLWFEEVAPKEERDAFATYLAALREGKEIEEAEAASFGPLDLAAVEKAWREWVLALKYE